MRANRKATFIAALFFLLLFFGGFFYYSRYHREEPKAGPKQNIGDLEFKLEALTNILGKEKSLARELCRGIKINYFSDHKLHSPRQAASFMFDRLKKLSDGLEISLIKFSPKERISLPGFDKIPFFIEVEGDYPRIIRLFMRLECEEGLMIDSLKISKPAARTLRPARLNCRFILCGIEIKGISPDILHDNEIKQVFRPGEYKTGLLLADRWEERKKIIRENIGSSPFSRSSITADMTGTDQSKTYGSADISMGISFSGIMSFPGHRVAIIGSRIVKEGDNIRGKKVVLIEENQVVLKDGNQLYFLKLAEGILRR